jgi:hypothetical protein
MPKLKIGAPSLKRSLVVAALAIGYLAVFAGQSFVTQQVFTKRFPGGNDFYPRWAGGCLRIWQGIDPYSEAATHIIQKGIYGRLAMANEDQVAYAYPLYTLAITWPLCFTDDFSLVRALWMTGLVHLLILGTALTRRLTPWRPPAWMWAATLGWAVFVYPNARAIILGQLSVVVFALVILGLVAIGRGRYAMAGLCMAAATIKPQMVFLLLAWLLWWTAWRHRWSFWAGFGGAMTALAVFGWILQPAWVAEFVHQVSTYTTYTEFGSLIWIVTTHGLGTPPWVEWALTLVFLVWMGWIWWRLRNRDGSAFVWGTSMTLVITHFVSPRTATTHFAPLALALFLVFALWQKEGEFWSKWKVVGTLGATLVGTWVLFAVTLSGRQESAWNYLPIPILLGIYIWVRRSDLMAMSVQGLEGS